MNARIIAAILLTFALVHGVHSNELPSSKKPALKLELKIIRYAEYSSKKPEYSSKMPEFLPKKPEFLPKKPEFLPKKPEFLLKKPEFLLKKREFLPRNPEFLLTLGGLAYRTVEELKRGIGELPQGTEISWAPGCCRFYDNEPLMTQKERDEVLAVCRSRGIVFAIIPSG